MKSKPRWILALPLISLFLNPAHAQSYKSELDLGVAAYKKAKYDEATQHFRKATELDPSQPAGHLYLATAYTEQYIPGVESPDNERLAEQAIEQYQAVLDAAVPLDSRISSSKGIAYLYFNMKRFNDAKHYCQKTSGFDPNDPEPYYSIGVVNWTLCYQPRMEVRASLGMRPEEHLDARKPDQKTLCDELQAKNRALIEEGIDSLNRAIQLRPDYDDAMAYLNLMFRERADLECEDPAGRRDDLKQAEHWVDRTLAVKKARAEKNLPSTAPSPR